MKALRKRVLLKSPVRKIRTPGSERGLSGNWQSYRNGGLLISRMAMILLYTET